jgi:hypothetical protein
MNIFLRTFAFIFYYHVCCTLLPACSVLCCLGRLLADSTLASLNEMHVHKKNVQYMNSRHENKIFSIWSFSLEFNLGYLLCILVVT